MGGDVPVEIGCDESGYEGEMLIGTPTDVFTHAGVHLDAATAAECVRELRRRIRSPAEEYKANHLLREKNRRALIWILGRSGPLHGHAHVHLVDKALFVVRAVVREVTEQDGAAAAALYRHGRGATPPGRWVAFLTAANDLLRTRPRTPGEAYVRSVRELRAAAPSPVADVLAALASAGPTAEARRALLLGDPGSAPPMDPLPPAIVRAVQIWGQREPVVVVHDRQNSLTGPRIARLESLLGGALAGVRLVDSRSDARVQVADFLAGVARKIASQSLNGRADGELVELLRPYVDPRSVWDQ